MKRNQGAGAIFVFAKEAKNLWASKPNTETLGGYLKKILFQNKTSRYR